MPPRIGLSAALSFAIPPPRRMYRKRIKCRSLHAKKNAYKFTGAPLYVEEKYEYQRRRENSLKRIAPEAEPEDAPPRKRTREDGEGVEMKMWYMYEQYPDEVGGMLVKIEDEKKRKVALQSALDAKEEEKAVLEKDNADKDGKLSMLTKENDGKSEELAAKKEECEEMKGTRQKEKDDLLAQLHTAESSAADWERRLEGERQLRTADHEEWQAQQQQAEVKHATLLGEQKEARVQDQQRWDSSANAASQEYAKLEETLEAERKAREGDEHSAAEALKTVVANSSAEDETRLQQEREAREQAEQERDAANDTLEQLRSRIAFLESEADDQKKEYTTLKSAHNRVLDDNAALLDERSGREREVQQAQSNWQVLQKQNAELQAKLSETQLTLQSTQTWHESRRKIADSMAEERKTAYDNEVKAKHALSQRAKAAEKLVDRYVRSGAKLPKRKSKPKPDKEAQTDSSFVSFDDMRDESMEDAKIREAAEDESESEDEDMDDDGEIANDIPDVQRHTSPTPSTSSSQASATGSSDADDDEDLPSNVEFDEALQLWNTDKLGALLFTTKLVERSLPSSSGMILYIAKRGAYIIKVMPKQGDLKPTDSGNTILKWSDYMVEKDISKLDGPELRLAIEDFQTRVVYACMLECQILAAQMVQEDESIVEELFQARRLTMRPEMVRKAAGNFIQKMTAINPGLMALLDRTNPKCCHELLKDPRTFQAAALQLARTPEFVRTIMAVADSQITSPDSGMGIWPAEMADRNAASRSLSSNSPVVEKKDRMGPPPRPVQTTSENEKAKVMNSFESLEVEAKDSEKELLNLFKNGKIDNHRKKEDLPSQKPLPDPLKHDGVFKKITGKGKPEKSKRPERENKPEKKGDKDAEAMFAFGLQTPPNSGRNTPEPGPESSDYGRSPNQSKKKYASPFVDDSDEEL